MNRMAIAFSALLLAAAPAAVGGATLPPVFVDAAEEAPVSAPVEAAVAARSLHARPTERAQTPSEVGA